ncbi:MAG: hypothetical protein LUF84_02470 [Clostridiales bacterium]|nr:hypothetical protein [Clostridiales bacterium]
MESYVSERVTNLSDLETTVEMALLTEEELQHEMEKARASTDRISALAKKLHDQLQMAKDFELCIERRKTICPDANSGLL